jgi:hypothetical protein
MFFSSSIFSLNKIIIIIGQKLGYDISHFFFHLHDFAVILTLLSFLFFLIISFAGYHNYFLFELGYLFLLSIFLLSN